MVQLLYGSGLRLMEVLRLRVKDVDFEYQSLIICMTSVLCRNYWGIKTFEQHKFTLMS